MISAHSIQQLADDASLSLAKTNTLIQALLGHLEPLAQEHGWAHVMASLHELTYSEHPQTALATLVYIDSDGQDGARYPLEVMPVEIGKSAAISFDDDDYLSPRHCKLSCVDGRIFVEDLESINGTFIRVRAPMALAHGDVFLTGRQVIRFVCDAGEAPRDKHGVLLMGSPSNKQGGMLQQIGPADEVFAVCAFDQERVIIGKDPSLQEGERAFAFEADAFQSRRHACVTKTAQGGLLSDLDSSNGTWLKLRRSHELHDQDHIFLGKQLFRLDLPQPQGLEDGAST